MDEQTLHIHIEIVHRTPRTVVPMGVMAEIDCSCVTFKIMESGVVEQRYGRY